MNRPDRLPSRLSRCSAMGLRAAISALLGWPVAVTTPWGTLMIPVWLGQAGPGSPAHIAGILFQKRTGTRFQFRARIPSRLTKRDGLGGEGRRTAVHGDVED